MGNHSDNLVAAVQKNKKNSLAPGTEDALTFRLYTQRVWFKVAGRPISEDEAEQIIEDFGRFLHALAGQEGKKP